MGKEEKIYICNIFYCGGEIIVVGVREYEKWWFELFIKMKFK